MGKPKHIPKLNHNLRETSIFPQVFVICVWLLWLPCLKPMLCRAGIIPDPANLARSFRQVRCSTVESTQGLTWNLVGHGKMWI